MRCAILVECFSRDGNKFFVVGRVSLLQLKMEQEYIFDNFDGAMLKFGDIESDCEIMQ